MAVMLKFQEVKVVEDIDPSLYEKKLKNKYQYFNNLFFYCSLINMNLNKF